MRVPYPVDRLVQEAQRRGASALHLIPGTAPRIRVQGELRPLDEISATTEDPNPESVAGLLSPEALEAFVDTVVPPNEKERVLRRGQGDYFLSTAKNQTLHTTIYRAMEQWRVVVLLTDPLPDPAAIDS